MMQLKLSLNIFITIFIAWVNSSQLQERSIICIITARHNEPLIKSLLKRTNFFKTYNWIISMLTVKIGNNTNNFTKHSLHFLQRKHSKSFRYKENKKDARLPLSDVKVTRKIFGHWHFIYNVLFFQSVKQYLNL